MGTLSHADYMKTALQLAERGRYTVSPNPMVGCVIVNHGEVVGEGYHIQAGGPHAEIMALQQAGQKAEGATAYVTLEPCCHYGRTPPCTNALIESGIKKVYIASRDPNPLVAGKGLEQLKDAGIDIEFGLHEQEATALNEIFFHYIRTHKPFVIAKWAMSLDGKTITHENDSSDISCSASRESSHHTRQQVDAILIGAHTAIRDNPLLTIRYPAENIAPLKQPLRIIMTRQGDLPIDLKLFDSTSSVKTLVATTNKANSTWIKQLSEKNIEVVVLPSHENGKIDLNCLLTLLGQRNITSLLVEGGMTVLHDFFHAKIVNKFHVYLAPTIIGSLERKQPVINLKLANIQTDFFITADYEGNTNV